MCNLSSQCVIQKSSKWVVFKLHFYTLVGFPPQKHILDGTAVWRGTRPHAERVGRRLEKQTSKTHKLVIPLFITIEEQRDVHRQKAIRRTRGGVRGARADRSCLVFGLDPFTSILSISQTSKEHKVNKTINWFYYIYLNQCRTNTQSEKENPRGYTREIQTKGPRPNILNYLI